MCHVQVAADDNGLLCVERFQVCTESVLPVHPVGKAGQFPLGVGRIARHKIERLKFQRDHAPFRREAELRLIRQAIADRKRRDACEHRRAGISLLHGAVPILLVALKRKLDLVRLELCLLQGDDIRIDDAEKFFKPFPQTGTKAVYIP